MMASALAEVGMFDTEASSMPVPPDFLKVEGLDDCTLEIAEGVADRRRAWALTYEAYREKGYAQPDGEGLWYGLHDALPNTRTLLATHHGRDVAAMTLVFDSPLGLPADELYAPENDALRRDGRRLCEIISLVNREPDRHAAIEILKNMFRLAYLAAARIEKATDFIITVNPHHVGYYERKLLFAVAGEERTYGTVSGAPAVLLRLDLETAEDRYEEKYGAEPGSFYSFFVEPFTQWSWVEFLRHARHGLAEPEAREWFTERRPLFQKASEPARAHLQLCYGW